MKEENVVHMNRRHLLILCAGILLLQLGVVTFSLLGSKYIGVLDAVWMAEVTRLANPLFISSILVVLLNTLQTLPLYLGVYLVSEVLTEYVKPRWLSLMIPTVLIPTIYGLIDIYSPSSYPFGFHLVMLIIGIALLNRVDTQLLGIRVKTIILIQYLLAIEWLDIVNWFGTYGFGLRQISIRINELAEAYGVDSVLSTYSFLISLIFLFSAAVSFVLIRILASSRREKLRVQQIKLKMAEARSGQEALFLVHDLKTPLTSIRGLNSLIGMYTPNVRIGVYVEKIEESIQLMNDMISEILYEDKRKYVSVQEIIDTVVASRLDGSHSLLTVEMIGEMLLLYANKTRVVRALVNLLNNAFNAIAGEPNGEVVLRVERSKSEVHFSVIDNGIGIQEQDLGRVWDMGFSTKNSTGAGLTYVRHVIESHHGTVAVRSTLGENTVVTVTLPGGEEEHANNINSG